MKYMITHPGPCHRDDLLCMAIFAAKYPECNIYRGEPANDEMRDPNILVVDVGMEHDPFLSNYDHHQIRHSDPAEWAFGLMLRGEWPELAEAFESCDWFATSRSIDSKGPFAVGKEMGLPADWTSKLWSPFEGALADMVASHNYIEPGTPLHTILKTFGHQLIKDSMAIVEAYKKIEKITVSDMQFGVEILWVNEVLDGAEMGALSKLQRKQYPNAAISISYDNRGGGMCLYRFNDHPSVNFSVLDSEDSVLFAHKGGFIAKTKEKLDRETILNLIEKSVK